MEVFPTVPYKHYRELRNNIRSGDLLFCSGNSIFSTLIKRATKSIWSHVAFVLRIDAIERIMVLESVESMGVRAIPLSNYISNYNATGIGYPGKIMLARHADVEEKNIAKLSALAVDFLGYPYGKEEIIHIAARISMHALGVHDFSPPTQHPRAFICSEYVHACFKSIGVDINYNTLGFISPGDFARHAKLKPFAYIHTENEYATCAPLHGLLQKNPSLNRF